MPNPTLTIAAALIVALSASAAVAQSAPLAAPAPVGAPVDAAKAAAAPTQKTAEQAAADRDNEIVCRRETEIASLVKSRKTCHTRAQWAYIAAENQRLGRAFVEANSGKPSGN